MLNRCDLCMRVGGQQQKKPLFVGLGLVFCHFHFPPDRFVHLFSCRHVVLTRKVSNCVVSFVGINQQHNPTFLISKTTEVQNDVHSKCDFELCGNLHFLLLLF